MLTARHELLLREEIEHAHAHAYACARTHTLRVELYSDLIDGSRWLFHREGHFGASM